MTKREKKLQPNEIRRRTLLSILGGSTALGVLDSPLALFCRSILQGVNSTAYAATAGIAPRRYLYVQQARAPSRWMFDLLLTPYSATGFVSNPYVGTKFTETGGRYTGLEYATIQSNGLNLPWLWQFDVPKVGGGTRPMTELLSNVLMLQGIDTKNAGHAASMYLHFRPGGSNQSLGALSADNASYPISAVNLDCTSFQFSSASSKSAVTVKNGGDMLSQLLNAFSVNKSLGYGSVDSSIQAAIDATVASIDQMVTKNNPLADAIAENRKSAQDLIRDGFTGLADSWVTLTAKYEALIQAAMLGTPMAGINDKPVGVTTARDASYNIERDGGFSLEASPDLRTLVNADTRIQNLAQHFAVAEYVLVNNISNSVSASIAGLAQVGANGILSQLMDPDEHRSGSMIVTLLNNLQHRAVAACLLELFDKFKAAGIWKDTVVDIGGEFNRSARPDGSGSDHGFTGKSTCLYSGAINGPLVLGNIQGDPGGSYPGTWGAGAPVAELGSRIGLDHMAATIAHLLKAPSPVTSAQSLVVLADDGTMIPVIEKTKIV